MKTHNGTILIPFRNQFKNGLMRMFSDHLLAVMVVLIHHENRETRLSFPSQDLIAIEAGVGKQNIPPAVNELEEMGMLTWGPGPIGRNGVVAEYKMEYEPYAEYPAQHMWFGMQSAVVSNGIWSTMPHSAKRLYLLLLALSWDGSWADLPHDAHQSEFASRENWGGEKRFVDATKLAPFELARLASLQDRTLRRAREWLFSNRLIFPNNDEFRDSTTLLYREGIMIADTRNMTSPLFQQRKAAHRMKAGTPSKGAKISLTRMKKSRRKKGVLVCGGGPENVSRN